MEAGIMPQRPPKVTLAVNLLYLSLVIWAIQCFLYWPPPAGSPAGQLGTLPMILMTLTYFAIDFGLYYMIGKGRRWARTIFLVFPVMAAFIIIPWFFILVFTEVLIPPFEDPTGLFPLTLRSIAETIFQFSQGGIHIAALILLFQRDSSDWFRAMKIWRKPQEVTQTWPHGLEPGEALIEAARRGDMKQIAHLLAIGADVNRRTNGV